MNIVDWFELKSGGIAICPPATKVHQFYSCLSAKAVGYDVSSFAYWLFMNPWEKNEIIGPLAERYGIVGVEWNCVMPVENVETMFSHLTPALPPTPVSPETIAEFRERFGKGLRRPII